MSLVESGGELGERAQEIFKKICNLITQATGQSGSSIALAKITHSNALKWAMAHNESKNPDSVPIDITDCYDDDIHETRRMMLLELLMKTKLFIATTEITVEDKTVIVATTHIYQGSRRHEI